MTTRLHRRAPLAAGAIVAALAGLVGGASAAGAAPPASADQGHGAPVLGAEGRNAIPGRFIVVFKNGAAPGERSAARAAAVDRGAQVRHEYRHALHGFAATLPAAALDGMRRNPNVAYIEADVVVRADDTQAGAPWGLDRSDQRGLPLNGSYTYDSTGAGVRAYVIDTGVRTTHTQFGGRAVAGYTAISDGRGAEDCNGHGTHVAGTVGASTYGLAKQVAVVAVRVLGCDGSGSSSGVIAGVDWVTGNHQAGEPAVANMSLGGGASSALDAAVAASISDGVFYAVAAGNENVDACNSSPARLTAAVTVGATTSADGRSSFSNYGSCLDLFAPGSSIQSAHHTSDTATTTMSGTSMATPHVAGAAALYLQAAPSAAPASVRDALVNGATANVVASAGPASPNRLLYAPLTTAPPSAPTPPPTTACSLPEMATGSLSGAKDSDVHPKGTYFSSGGGSFRGCLAGPSGTDFDLLLQKWNGRSWVTVAQGVTSSSTENVTYAGTSGYYRWLVRSYSGAGTYTFGMQRP